MKNFINSRISGFNNLKIEGMYKHDLRVTDSRNKKNNNANFLYDVENDRQIKIVYMKQRDLEKLPVEEQEKYKIDRKILLEYFKEQKINYQIDRQEHNQKFKNRRKKNLTDSVGSHAEGILTFSEKIREDYNNGKLDIDKFMKSGIETAKQSCKYLDAELINVILHLDEKTPHFHYIFKNFDDMGRSLSHIPNIKKKGKCLEELQDIAAEGFEAFEVDRGISKEISGRTRYTTTKEYYETELYKQNKSIKINKETLTTQAKQIFKERGAIAELIQEKTEIANSMRAEYLKLTNIKKELKEQRSNFERDSITYKQLTKNYKEIVQLDNSKRSEYKELKTTIEQHKNTQKSLESRIDSLIEENTQKQALNDELDTSITKKEKILKNQKSIDNIFIKRVNEIVEKNDSILGINHKNLKIDIVKELKKVSGLNVNLETSRKDRMAANDANIEKKDIEKRYVQLLKDNEKLEDLLLKERLSHKNLKDNSIQKEIINGILEKSNMPNLSELEEMQKKKEKLENKERKKSNSSMRFR